MGTRATIRVNGVLRFATHWDGYVEALGKELASIRKHGLPIPLSAIRAIAAKHQIDFEGRGLVWYDDFSEYEYDINTRTGAVKVIELGGQYKIREKGRSWYI